MALIPLLFISISDSLVILVFLRAFDFEKGGVVVFSSSSSQNSSSPPPHISVLSTVAKHTHTQTHASLGCIRKKVSPALDDDDKQNRSEEAPGRRILGFYYTAPVRTRNLVREMKEIWCFARRAL